MLKDETGRKKLIKKNKKKSVSTSQTKLAHRTCKLCHESVITK
jgi:hypothetical protein